MRHVTMIALVAVAAAPPFAEVVSSLAGVVGREVRSEAAPVNPGELRSRKTSEVDQGRHRSSTGLRLAGSREWAISATFGLG